jgi:ketosteroid isomerase-like protein
MKPGFDETAVGAANLAFYRALQARDMSAMDMVWLHDASASCIHPGWHRLDGWAEVRRSWENVFANARPWTVACEDVRINVAGDVAWVTCVEVLAPLGADTDDGAARMQATNIFVRADGVWRLLHHHASPTSTQAEEEEQPVN